MECSTSMEIYEEQYRQRQITFLKRKAAELGLEVVAWNSGRAPLYWRRASSY